MRTTTPKKCPPDGIGRMLAANHPKHHPKTKATTNIRRRAISNHVSFLWCYFHSIIAVIVIMSSKINGFYISYEKSNYYKQGDSVPMRTNKLTSPVSLSSRDYKTLPVCSTPTSSNNEKTSSIHPESLWQQAMQSIHGDMYYAVNDNNNNNLFQLNMLQDSYCMHACYIDLMDDNNSEQQRKRIVTAIEKNFQYNWYIDNLPTSYWMENERYRTIRNFGGIPIGLKGSDIMTLSNVADDDYNPRFANVTNTDLLLYNHYNFRIHYNKIQRNDETHYQIIRAYIEPLSIQRLYSTSVTTPIDSCRLDSLSGTTAESRQHTSFDMLREIPPLLVNDDVGSNNGNASSHGITHFTYDVIWVENDDESVTYKNRWNTLLTMDHAIPFVSFAMGLALGCVILIMVLGSLFVWLLRDLSYKPIVNLFETEDLDEDEEERLMNDARNNDDNNIDDMNNEEGAEPKRKRNLQYDEEEIQMWPLSTRIFFPPLSSPIFLCIVAGTGAQNLICGFIFVVLFRLGIISQISSSDGPINILTGAVTVYAACGPPVGGYVAGRLYRVLHGDRLNALAASLVTAIFYPLIGMLVTWLVYDVLPHMHDDGAPHYNTISNSMPVVYVWIFYMWPVTVIAGWFGYRGGPIQYFPVSKGVQGYQDLDLQDSKTMARNSHIDTTTKETSTVSASAADVVVLPVKSHDEEKKEEEDENNHEVRNYSDDENIHDGDTDDDDHIVSKKFRPYGMSEVEEMPRNYHMSDDYAASIPENSGECDDDVSNKKEENSNLPAAESSRWCMVLRNKTLQWKSFRIPVLLMVGGILPVLSAFVNYSYGIAAPIFLRYYSNTTFIIASFILFVANATAVAVLLYYRQIRVAGSHNQSYYYQWWWASIASGGSAGLYLFLLSMSWLLRYRIDDSYDVSASTWALYVLWFAYISFGAALMTGFCGLAGCILFNRALYRHIIRIKEVA